MNHALIGTLVAFLFACPTLVAKTGARKVVYVPSQGIETLQQAVDSIQSSGTIFYQKPYTNGEVTQITNKNIRIIGQLPNGARPIIETNRFSDPYSIKVEGSSNVEIKNISFIAGRNAVLGESLNGLRPNLTIDGISARLSVRVISGQFSTLKAQNLSLIEIEGQGMYIEDFDHVFVNPDEGSTSQFFNGRNYGIYLRSNQLESTVEIKNVSVVQFPSGGISIENVKGLVDLSNVSLFRNRNAGLSIKNSKNVSLRNVSINQTEFGTQSANGLMITQSEVVADNLNIQNSGGHGIVTYACGDTTPSMIVDIRNSRVSLSGASSWISGRTLPCQNERWDWSVLNPDKIFSSSFEDDQSLNVCQQSQISPPTVCRAVRGPDVTL